MTPQSPPTTNLPSRRQRHVQGLRGVAVLVVVLYHAGLWTHGGFVGVDIFFVISGYVITGLVERQFAGVGKVALREFYLRRLRRLGPALATMSVLVTLTGFVLLSPLRDAQIAGSSGLSASLIIANARLFLLPDGYFAAPSVDNPYLHTWSLSVEEQFYLVFPIVLILLLRRRRPIAVIALAALGAASLAGCVAFSFSHAAVLHSHGLAFAFYSSPTRAWEFVAGALLALLYDKVVALPTWVRQVSGAIGAALAAWAIFGFTTQTVFPGTAAIIPVAGAALLIASGIGTDTVVSTCLCFPPLSFLGDLSYSWYLWHWPVLAYARILDPTIGTAALAGLAAASLLPAWASYKLVETPLRYRSVDRRAAIRLVAVTVALPALLCAALWGSANIATGSVRQMRAQLGSHLDDTLHCQGNLPGDAKTTGVCSTQATASKGRIVLLGDSNAGQFAEPVSAIADQSHYDFTLATFPACPFDHVLVSPGTSFDTSGCLDFVTTWTQALVAAKPSLVILSSASSDYFFTTPVTEFANPSTGARTSDLAAKAALWQDGMNWVLSRLRAAGVPVLLIHTVPHFVNWGPESCLPFELYRDTTSCGRAVPIAVMHAQQRIAAEAENLAVQANGDTSLDLTQQLCPDNVCVTNIGNRWFYRDGGHLSVGGALSLQPEIASAISSIL